VCFICPVPFSSFSLIFATQLASFEERIDENGPSTHRHHNFATRISVGPKQCQTCTIRNSNHGHTVNVRLPVTSEHLRTMAHRAY
jgi:hypothetical protein